MKETYTKLNNDTFKRVMGVEREDVFKLPHLQQEKKDLEEKIAPFQARLNEVKHIILEINKVK